MKSKGTVAILCGGGPAPGINTVIGTAAKSFLLDGFRVLGIHGGYKGLFSEKPDTKEINFAKADNIFKTGGSYLKMSRHKPKDEEFSTKFFVENDIRLLITIGGDDTASTANRISKYLESNNIKIQNIHVPKTIDNDLPLSEDQYTFGYMSAKEEGSRITTTVYEDARTSDNWFVISVMGREAGHLAFGIGSACHLPMIIIPEMFNKTTITIEKIIRLMISSIIKRKLIGINYGAIGISEGVFHYLSEEEIKNCGINFTYDDHGHPELGIISKAHIFNILLQEKVRELNLNVKSRPVEIGYEVRCVQPTAFDKMYCARLGMGIKQLFDANESGCMVTVDSIGSVRPLYLRDVEGKDGKVKPRLVQMSHPKTKMVYRQNQQYLTEEDYHEAKKYLSDPSYYDFFNILNWKPEDLL